MPQSDAYPGFVGLSGPAGCGKDTAAQGLLEFLGYARIALADPLREATAALLGVPTRQLHDREYKERDVPCLGVSPRRIMQTMGTEWGRSVIGDDVWIRLLSMRAADYDRVVVPDVRFDNEAEWIRSQGGVVFRIERPGCAAVEAHPSEGGVSDRLIDGTIINNAGTHELMERTRSAVIGWVRMRNGKDAPAESQDGTAQGRSGRREPA